MRNPYVKVAAKSGSAQNPHSKLTHAWVAGYFPADKDPEVVFVCLLEGAGGGGVMAGGMAKRFLDKYLEVERALNLLKILHIQNLKLLILLFKQVEIKRMKIQGKE